MVGCVEGICGMRPDADGLTISPSIPAEWDGMKMHKLFRGKQLEITVQNPNHVQSGVASLTLNGTALEGNYIPAEQLTDTNQIVVVLG
jgi:cellobiose phosphorylase